MWWCLKNFKRLLGQFKELLLATLPPNWYHVSWRESTMPIFSGSTRKVTASYPIYFHKENLYQRQSLLPFKVRVNLFALKKRLKLRRVFTEHKQETKQTETEDTLVLVSFLKREISVTEVFCASFWRAIWPPRLCCLLVTCIFALQARLECVYARTRNFIAVFRNTLLFRFMNAISNFLALTMAFLY